MLLKYNFVLYGSLSDLSLLQKPSKPGLRIAPILPPSGACFEAIMARRGQRLLGCESGSNWKRKTHIRVWLAANPEANVMTVHALSTLPCKRESTIITDIPRLLFTFPSRLDLQGATSVKDKQIDLSGVRINQNSITENVCMNCFLLFFSV